MYICGMLCALIPTELMRIRSDEFSSADSCNHTFTRPPACSNIRAHSHTPTHSHALTQDQEKAIRGLGLLTRKPVIYAANVEDSDLAEGNNTSTSTPKQTHTQTQTDTHAHLDTRMRTYTFTHMRAHTHNTHALT